MDSLPPDQPFESLWGDDTRLDGFHSGIDLFHMDLDAFHPLPGTPDLPPPAIKIEPQCKQQLAQQHTYHYPQEQNFQHNGYHSDQLSTSQPLYNPDPVNYEARNPHSHDLRQAQYGKLYPPAHLPNIPNGQWNFREQPQHSYQSQRVPEVDPRLVSHGHFGGNIQPHPSHHFQANHFQNGNHFVNGHDNLSRNWNGGPQKIDLSPKSGSSHPLPLSGTHRVEDSLSDSTLEEDDMAQQSPLSRIPSPLLDSSLAVEGSHVLQILGLPSKSRVETRMKPSLRVSPADPDSASRILRFRIDDCLLASAVLRTRLTPEKRIQQKLLRQYPNNKIPILTAQVFDSTGTRLIKRCHSCVQRERKILLRKAKDKNISFGILSLEQSSTSVVQFYCEPLVEFSSGEAVLPMRLTCYCRHHQEPNGFLIKLSLVDLERKAILAEAFSGLVLITDDRKSQRKRGRVEHPQPETPQTTPKPRIKKEVIQPVPNQQIQQASPYFAKKFPTVGWAIPSEGPISGGIAVTVLGSNFHTDLSCYFGVNKAPRVQLWGDSTLIATLPPSATPGQVKISLRDERAPNDAIPNPSEVTFAYIDDSNRQLLELALQVICLKLNGNVQDPSTFAAQMMPPSGFIAGGYRIGSDGGLSGIGGPIPDISSPPPNTPPPILKIKSEPSEPEALSSDSTNASESEDDDDEGEFDGPWPSRGSNRDRDGNGGPGHSHQGGNNDGDGGNWYGDNGSGSGRSRLNSGSGRRTYQKRTRADGTEGPPTDQISSEDPISSEDHLQHSSAEQEQKEPKIETNTDDLEANTILLPFDIHRALQKRDQRPVDQSRIAEVLKLTLSLKTPYPINFSFQNKRGQQMLHFAVAKDYEEIIRVLLQKNVLDLGIVDLDLQDCNGWTALHFAAFHGADRWVMKLLECGANKDILTNSGEKAVDLARYQSTALLFTPFPLTTDEPEADLPVVAPRAHDTTSQEIHRPVEDPAQIPENLLAPTKKERSQIGNGFTILISLWALFTFALAFGDEFLDYNPFSKRTKNLVLVLFSVFLTAFVSYFKMPAWIKACGAVTVISSVYAFLSTPPTPDSPSLLN